MKQGYNIYKSDKIYKTRIKAIPIEHHYEEDGENSYIKYSCPICESLRIKHQIQPWEDNCKICGINLDWSGINERGIKTRPRILS